MSYRGRRCPDVREGSSPMHRRVLYGSGSRNSSRSRTRRRRRIVATSWALPPARRPGESTTRSCAWADFSMRYAGRRPGTRLDRRRHPAAMRYTEGAPDQARRGDGQGRHRQGDRRLVPNTTAGAERGAAPPRCPTCSSTGGSAHASSAWHTIILAPHLSKLRRAVPDDRDPQVELARYARAAGPDFPRRLHPRSRHPQATPPGAAFVQMRARAAARPQRRARSRRSSSPNPYQVNKARLIERSPSWCARRRSRASRTCATRATAMAIRIVLEVKRRGGAEIILNPSTSSPDAVDVRIIRVRS